MSIHLKPLMPFALLLMSTTLSSLSAESPDTRARALLAQMTLDEKIGQMTQADLNAVTNKADIQKYALGSMLSGGDSDPANNLPATWLATVRECQSWALKTRLKIPLLYGIDAVHGHNNIDGAVIFPHNIGLGATHNPALVEQAEHVTAIEVAATGIHWAFTPCVAVVRNPRWGRTYESFSQSPELVSELGEAAVKGLQTPLPNGFSVLACAKHFLADGGTQNGIDRGNSIGDENTLRSTFLAPYLAAIKANVGSIMVSYSSWNGQKMHGNKHLLTDILKDQAGFQGFLVSDWAAIDELGRNYKSDIEKSINAGLDMVMIPHGPGKTNNFVEFIQDLKQLVSEGRVPQSRIDDAVLRILRVKYQFGLFEHPFADPDLLNEIGSPEHRLIARDCVRQSLVLLKNQNHTLPLSKSQKALVVLGRGADDLGLQCGGWTITWQGKSGPVTHGGTTILAAIRDTVNPSSGLTFAPEPSSIPSTPAPGAIIVVVGEPPYAEMRGDRSDLRLSSADITLVKEAKKTGVPVITVVLSGRPLILGDALTASDAVLAAWLPGTEGKGVADVLFGDYKPSGKLPRAWVRDNHHLATDTQTDPATVEFPLGFGLTY
jgi:beta-glucosidase